MNFKQFIFLPVVTCVYIYAEKKELTTIELHDAWKEYPPASISAPDNAERIEFRPASGNESSLHDRVLQYVQNQRLQQVQEQISNTVKDYSDQYHKHIQSGILYAQHSFFSNALTEFSRARTLQPENHTAYNNTANVYYLSHDFDNAIHFYEQSLRVSPGNPLTLLNLSFIQYENGKLSKARENYHRAVLIQPTLLKDRYRVLISGNKNSD
jgi:tetratricopeptide (TPR) repeat protein